MFVRAQNVHKSFMMGKTKLEVLKGVDLSINFGEFVAIMGSSGSGKSTMLYLLGLLDDVNKGEVIIHNLKSSHLSAEEKTNTRLKYMGYVFQDFNLINELTVLENVALIAYADKSDKVHANKKAKEVLTLVGLASQINKKPNQLSGGQQQRVAIARALVNDPLILFADEPTANLDSKTSKSIIDLFKELNKTRKLTIIMVTHEEEFRKEVDRVIELKDGVVIE